ncbi:MAG: TaqI-like C-terminal specificity domain-containing protein, partial [Bacteroidota bacterium]
KSVKGKLLLNENIQKHLEFWQAYKEKLMSIKVLDPACGSGAFLNQAFNYLYAEGQSVNEKIAGLQIGQGELFELDKHILSNNLYGVDLNTESVNITKLSLWIKTANKYSELTALDDNIKCGNSLIDDPEVAGNKAFNWFREFPQVFPGYRVYSKKKTNVKEPDFEYSEQEEEQTPTVQEPSYSYEIESKGFEKHGFDVIIGNPPYVRVTEENDYNYFMNKYQSASNRIDLYALFFEKAMSLLKDKGFISFITPITFLTNLQNRKLRKMILDLAIVKIVDFRFNVFADAKVDTIITVISKNNNTDNKIKVFKIFDFQNPDQFKNVFVEIEQNAIQDIININSNFSVLNLNSKIEQNSIPLEKICKIRNGINPGYPESRKHLLIENPYKGVNPKKRLDAKDIYKYGFEWFNKWIDYDTNFKVDGGSLREESLFIKPKIIIQDIRNLKLHTRLVATFDDNCYYNLYTLHNIQSIDNSVDNKYLLVILNSKLMNFYFAHNYKDIHIKPRYLAILPFKKIGKNHQQSFIALADLMLDKNKELQQIRKAYLEFVKGQFGITKPTTKLQEWYNLSFEEFVKELEKSKVKLTTTQKFDLKPLFDREQEKALEIKAIIETTDKKIDQMVYTLYGLTEEEIRIVEGE